LKSSKQIKNDNNDLVDPIALCLKCSHSTTLSYTQTFSKWDTLGKIILILYFVHISVDLNYFINLICYTLYIHFILD